MKTVEETLTELVDREEIRDLPVRYCDCVWRGDVAGIVELFAADGSFTVKTPDGETVQQRAVKPCSRRTPKDCASCNRAPIFITMWSNWAIMAARAGDAISTCAAKNATWNGSDPATILTNT